MFEKNIACNGDFVAKYFKYFLQLKNPYVLYKLPVERVSSKKMYSAHKQQFDKLAEICNKYNLDAVKYLDFFVNKFMKTEKDVDCLLASSESMNKYAEHLQIAEYHNDIYRKFLKSVDNIVADCIKMNYNTVIDYMHHIIKTRKISAYLLSGKISMYYFAAIPKFNKVIEKMDKISKDEFKILYDRYDKYHSDVNESFLKMKNIKINPIKFTNDAILKAKNVQF